MLNVGSKEDIEFCMQTFNRPSIDLTVAKRKVKFLTKYCHNGNSLCSVFRNRDRGELDKIGLNATLYQLIYLLVKFFYYFFYVGLATDFYMVNKALCLKKRSLISL